MIISNQERRELAIKAINTLLNELPVHDDVTYPNVIDWCLIDSIANSTPDNNDFRNFRYFINALNSSEIDPKTLAKFRLLALVILQRTVDEDSVTHSMYVELANKYKRQVVQKEFTVVVARTYRSDGMFGSSMTVTVLATDEYEARDIALNNTAAVLDWKALYHLPDNLFAAVAVFNGRVEAAL